MDTNTKLRAITTASLLLAGLTMAGCGGSSGGGTTATSPNGIYSGTITGGNSSFNGIEEKGVIYNNRMMVLSNNANGVSQLFDADLSEPSVSLTGTGVRYSSTGLNLNTVAYSGVYVAEQSANVDFTEVTTGAPTLSDGTIVLTADTSTYSKSADISKVAGNTWTGFFDSGFGLSMSIVVDATGNIVAGSLDDVAGGCVFTGSLSVIDPAINLYTVNLISDGGAVEAVTCLQALIQG